MEVLMDPAIWVGLVTLIVLEIVLGIDNLVFIAILADKLPPHQRDRARMIGLTLALLMRLGLLSVISWLATLTAPLFDIAGKPFSGRDLILILGGVFLLFKATVELHERLEGAGHAGGGDRVHAGFWVVVAQIVALDAVFSLDSVITAVGMVDSLAVMMIAVVVAIAVMMVASKPLTRFVNAHPTVVVLCLAFLLMIGLSLVADGLGFHIPKGYLYAAIGFSILIESFNQMARRNVLRRESRRPLRDRTAEAILRLVGGARTQAHGEAGAGPAAEALPADAFGEEERQMIHGVLRLGDRTVRSIMTPRNEVSWIDCDDDPAAIRAHLMETPHAFVPVCRGTLDELIGVARAKDLLVAIDGGNSLADLATHYPPIVVPPGTDVIRLLGVLRRAKGRFVLVADEFGVVQGLVTPLDVLEAIAGEFPDEDETPDIVRDADGWLVKGRADLHLVEQMLADVRLPADDDEYASIAGLLLARFGRVPATGEGIDIDGYRFEVAERSGRRIELVRVRRIAADQHEGARSGA